MILTYRRLARRAALFFGDLQHLTAVLAVLVALFGLLTCVGVFAGLYVLSALPASLCVVCAGNPFGQIAGYCDERGWAE